MRGEEIDTTGAVDLSQALGGGKEFVGVAQLKGHSRLDRVIVSLKNPGELTEEHLQEILAAAQHAAIAASRMPG